MSFIDNFENRFLFGLTRYLATLIVFCLIAVVVVGAVVTSGSLGGKISTKVGANEVLDVIKPVVAKDVASPVQGSSLQPNPVETNLLPGIKLPFSLQKHFSTPANVKVLRGWLNAIPDEYQLEFIDEMAAAAVAAENQKLDASDAINAYKELKFKKLEQLKFSKAELDQKRLYFAGAAGVCIALIALFSLILVLLAIERNTRKVPA